ncbi:MAG: septum formation inhibitor Maf, partial [Proteobacteria bacterium]
MRPTLYLASRSPRRRELLGQAGLKFEIYVPK